MRIFLLLLVLLLPSLAHATVDWDEGFEYSGATVQDMYNSMVASNWATSCDTNSVIIAPTTQALAQAGAPAPHSGTRMLEERFRGHQGITPGYQSCYIDRNLNAPTTGTLYTRFWVYLNNFTVDSTMTKLTLHPAYASDSYTSVWWAMFFGASRFDATVQHNYVVPALGDSAENIYGLAIPQNQWVCLETQLTYATPGQSNGIVRNWVNDVQSINRTDVWMDQAGQQSVFRTVRLYVQDGMGTIYYDDYAVSRDARIGCGGGGAPPTDTTPPSTPTSFNVSVSGVSATLTWVNGTDNTGGSGLAGTDIFYCTGAACTPTNALASVSAASTSYIAASLSAATVYGFNIKHRDYAGNTSSATTTAYVTTDSQYRTVLATDLFTRADATTLGANWTAGYDTENGATENFGINTNRTINKSLVADSIATYNAITTPDDQYISADIATYDAASAIPGLLVRASGAPGNLSGYECRLLAPGTTARLARWSNGEFTQLVADTGITAIATGGTIRCETEGTTIRFYKTVGGVDTLLLSTTDATHTAGQAGLIGFSATSLSAQQFDNVTIGGFSVTPPAAPEFTTLDAGELSATLTYSGSLGSFRVVTETGSRVETDLSVIVGGVYTYPASVLATLTDFICFYARDEAGTENPEPLCDAVVKTNIDYGPNTGVLHVHPTNARWLTNDSGKALVFSGPSGGDVVGSAARGYAYLQDYAAANAPMVNNPVAAVASMTTEGLNFMRLWIDIASAWGDNAEFAAGTYWTTPTDQMPWVRVGTRVDTSTGYSITVGIYDLTQFNQAFFDRVRTRVVLAANAGIATSVMLLNAYPHFDYVDHSGFSTPFYAANNVNGVSCDGNANGRCEELFATTNTAMLAVMDAYVDKLVDTLNPIDSLIWEMVNECKTDCSTWANRMADRIAAREALAGRQAHPIWMTPWTDATTNTWLYNNTHAQIISPLSVEGENFEDAPPANAGTATVSVWFYDTDHWGNLDGQVDIYWAWKTFLRGINPLLLDSDAFPREDEATKTAIKLRMAQALSYSARVDLAAMTVETGTSIIATGYGLYNACSEYLMYQPTAATNAIDLSACVGQSFTTEYLDPATGTITTAALTGGGASRDFTAAAERVVYLKLDPTTDSTPPVVFGGSPSGVLLATTTSVVLMVHTDEPATCRYGLAGGSYASQPFAFDQTSVATTHTVTQSQTAGASYQRNIRCQDATGNATTSDYVVSWSVAAQADTTPPVLSAPFPTAALPAGTTSTTIGFLTSEAAACKYHTTDTTYALMGTTMTVSNLTASATVSGLTNGSTTTYYGRCQDFAEPTPNASTQSIVITVVVESSTADTTPPGTVSGLAAQLVGAQAILTWPTASGGDISGYRVYRCGISDCSDKIVIQQLGNTTTTIVGLQYNSRVYFAVDALDTSNNPSAAISNIVTVTTGLAPDYTPPSDMTNLRVLAVYQASIALAWTPGSDSQGTTTAMIEYCAGVDCSNFTPLKWDIRSDTLIVTLAPATRYRFRGKHWDQSGNESVNYSSIVDATTAAYTANGLSLPRQPVPFSQPRLPRS